ncbi:hypothetical protein BC830DRAFT_1249606 [Chytriomyces sp. MP71]|nr:hypothetical protein BC830DRAFT_1249606 [Chytriomyces sp. MP71]
MAATKVVTVVTRVATAATRVTVSSRAVTRVATMVTTKCYPWHSNFLAISFCSPFVYFSLLDSSLHGPVCSVYLSL